MIQLGPPERNTITRFLTTNYVFDVSVFKNVSGESNPGIIDHKSQKVCLVPIFFSSLFAFVGF